MSTVAEATVSVAAGPTSALETDFPIVQVSELAEQESWRKEINRPIYHIHKWWATRLGSVFRAITLGALSPAGADVWKGFYDRHDFANKIVLDPFMGSGTTIGEALKLGAKAIGSDINPVSTFLVRQELALVSELALRAAFHRLEDTVAPAIRHYYQTPDPETGEPLPVLYYFWCKTVTTPGGEVLPLLSRYVFAQDAYPKKKPDAQIVCPKCWQLIRGRYDSMSIKCSYCSHRFDPQQGPAEGQYVRGTDGTRYRIKDLIRATEAPPQHRLYALLALKRDGQKVYLPARPEDHTLYREAEACLEREVLPLPTLAVRPGHNTNQALGYNYRHWRDFFNSRQLLCLGMLLRGILEIQDRAVQEQMLCLFSSTLEFNNLFCSFKGEGTGAVRHMFSHHILKPERTPLENSVWGTDKSSGTFCTLFESRLLPAKRYLDEPFELQVTRDLFGKRNGTRKITASAPIRTHCVRSWDELTNKEHATLILNGDSAALPIPDGSVDAVITDPPYFDFVHYSELSDFFFSWLAPILSRRYPWMKRADSSHKGEVQHKDPRVFAHQLTRVLAECRRVLKDDGVLAFSFHHSRPEGWAAIHEAVADAGLTIVAAHPLHAELRAASPKTAAKEPISLDAILVCRKDEQISSTDFHHARAHAGSLLKELRDSGLTLSQSDSFVVLASQMLIPLSQSKTSYDEALALLCQECSPFNEASAHDHSPAFSSALVGGRQPTPRELTHTRPGGHPNSSTCGHPKIPHLS